MDYFLHCHFAEDENLTFVSVSGFPVWANITIVMMAAIVYTALVRRSLYNTQS